MNKTLKIIIPVIIFSIFSVVIIAFFIGENSDNELNKNQENIITSNESDIISVEICKFLAEDGTVMSTTITKYDDNGNIVYGSLSEGDDSKPFVEETYEYDEFGRLIKMESDEKHYLYTYEELESGSMAYATATVGEDTFGKELVYDTNYRLISEKSYKNSVLIDSVEKSYHSNGNVNIEVWGKGVADSNIVTSNYDEKGRIIKKITELGDGEYLTTEYTYNDSFPDAIFEEYAECKQWNNVDQILDFDKKLEKISDTVYKYTSVIDEELASYSIITVDGSGKITEKKVYSPDDTLKSVTTIKYDSAGRIVDEKKVESDGSFVSHYVYQYK